MTAYLQTRGWQTKRHAFVRRTRRGQTEPGSFVVAGAAVARGVRP